jgi:hypothetical protein
MEGTAIVFGVTANGGLRWSAIAANEAVLGYAAAAPATSTAAIAMPRAAGLMSVRGWGMETLFQGPTEPPSRRVASGRTLDQRRDA